VLLGTVALLLLLGLLTLARPPAAKPSGGWGSLADWASGLVLHREAGAARTMLLEKLPLQVLVTTPVDLSRPGNPVQMYGRQALTVRTSPYGRGREDPRSAVLHGRTCRAGQP
jgi:hypothetical protein